VKILDIAEFSINNLDSASLGTSPFFFANGMITENSGICALDDFIVDLQEIQEKAIEFLTQTKRQQALYHDSQRKSATQYQPGDLVMLLRKFIQSRRINSKLDYRYIGPFKVIEMVGENAVRLDIAHEYSKLHPVFNVSLVAKYHAPSQFASQGTLQGIKDTFHDSGLIVNWSKLHQILDACPRVKPAKESLNFCYNGSIQPQGRIRGYSRITFLATIINYYNSLSHNGSKTRKEMAIGKACFVTIESPNPQTV
jgi:hypothetical protein